MIRRTMLSRRRLLGSAAALTAGSLGWTGSVRTAFGATQILPASAVEVADGAFFPIFGGGSGFYVRDVAGGPQFWSFYDSAGGHTWYGPPISGVWEDSNNWYQLFACVLFIQSKHGGPPDAGAAGRPYRERSRDRGQSFQRYPARVRRLAGARARSAGGWRNPGVRGRQPGLANRPGAFECRAMYPEPCETSLQTWDWRAPRAGSDWACWGSFTGDISRESQPACLPQRWRRRRWTWAYPAH